MIKLEVQKKILFLGLMFFLAVGNIAFSQVKEYSRSSVIIGIGPGGFSSFQNDGFGSVLSFGLQKSFGRTNKLRFNPNLMIGGFLNAPFFDGIEISYFYTSIGFYVHYDVIRYKSVSVVTSIGGLLNQLRGSSTSAFFAGSLSAGIRISPKYNKLAFEIRPLNFQFGRNGWLMVYLQFGIDIRLEKNNIGYD